MKKLLLLAGFLTFNFGFAQDEARVIREYLGQERAQFNLTASDVQSPALKSSSFSQSMNVTTAYANQTHQGIEVFNTTSRFAIRDGQGSLGKIIFCV